MIVGHWMARAVVGAAVLLAAIPSCSPTPPSSDGTAEALTDPLPAPVENLGLGVEVADVVRLPETRGLRPADEDVNPAGWARGAA